MSTGTTATPPGPAPAPPPTPLKRYPLSLPPGSVRAIHVLAIVGLVCIMILMPGKFDPAVKKSLDAVVGLIKDQKLSREDAKQPDADLKLPNLAARENDLAKKADDVRGDLTSADGSAGLEKAALEMRAAAKSFDAKQAREGIASQDKALEALELARKDLAENAVPLAIPPYLIYLLFIMLGHYFAAHGVTINAADDPSPSPLFLPGGTVRALIVLLLCGCIGWKIYSDPAVLRAQFVESLEHLKDQPYLPIAILAGFFVGVGLAAIARRISKPAWWQDIEAWISLVALIGLGISALLHLIIDRYSDVRLTLPVYNTCLGAVVAFYFGMRS